MRCISTERAQAFQIQPQTCALFLQCSTDSSTWNKTVIPPPETEHFQLCFNIICFVFCIDIQLLYKTVKELTKDRNTDQREVTCIWHILQSSASRSYLRYPHLTFLCVKLRFDSRDFITVYFTCTMIRFHLTICQNKKQFALGKKL